MGHTSCGECGGVGHRQEDCPRNSAEARELNAIWDALEANLGGDEDKAIAWMDAENAHLGGVPRKIASTKEGRAQVLGYLELMLRGSG